MQPTTNRQVLVLEDDAQTRLLLREVLQVEMGLDVTEANDAEGALEVLDVGPIPALLIVDLMLPGLDGESFMVAVRRRFGPDLPIMVLSALQRDQVEASARRGEAQAFMVKPFEIAAFMREVASLLTDVQEHVRLKAPCVLALNSVADAHKRTTDHQQDRCVRLDHLAFPPGGRTQACLVRFR